KVFSRQSVTPTPSTSLTASWVARQIDARDKGRDGRLEMRMRLIDRHGRARERALTVSYLDAGKAATSARDLDGDRLLVRFTYPNDIKGTAFLVWEHARAEDERFLYLPALGRVRRIAGSERQESFVGSDFTYEDIGGRELDDYTYELLDENATWSASDGRTFPAYRLESRALDKTAPYPRSISLVRKDSFVVVLAEIYNRRNEREKLFEVRKLEQVQGIWTALDIVMVNDLDHTRTELQVTKTEYNIGLSPSAFSRLELERGG
ncbi:MAG: outer membrane lipoprotein-sorting protein, partial [Acidobacteria bacterium]|nr:outer membrane lipoprotein-sorting protein [Acidobacteriota bacterium]